VNTPLSTAPLIGPVPQDEILNVSVGLAIRNPQGLLDFIKHATNPKDPAYRKFLSQAQFVATYSPSAADYSALQSFATANELTITQTFPNNELLRVSGRAGAIERAFYVNLNNYARPDNSAFYALDRDPSLDLSLKVLRISGLDNLILGTTSAGTGSGGSFQGNDFRNAYLGSASACSPLTGAGQSIGLFELDSYNPPDITQYENQAGIPPVALNPVSIISASGGGSPPSVSSGNTRLEVAGDIEAALAMAPGATITPVMAASR
jgi:kumamolisin